MARGNWTIDNTPEPVLQRLEFRGDLNQACSRLSFGNLRKLMLAEALSSSARLILLDEPMAGLDDAGRQALLPLVTETLKRGVSVVIAEQDADPWSSASRVIRIADGALHEAERPQLSSVRFEGEASHLATVRALATTLGLREVEDD